MTQAPATSGLSASLRAGVKEGRRTGALHVLVACVAAIVGLLLTYERHARGAPGFADERWDLDLDRSYIEVAGYAFVLAAAVLLLALFARRGAPVYAGWATGFVILVADDALELHERAGRWLDGNLDVIDPPGLRVVDLGELAFWAGAGAIVSVVLVATHRRSCRSAQQHSYRLAALMALLMVFAVGVDMLHILVKSLLDAHRVDLVLISLEAAGEAGVMAGLAAYALHLTRRPVHGLRRGT